MPSADPADLVARLDRITALLVAVVVLQVVDVLGLGPAGLAVAALAGLFVTALYYANPGSAGRR